MALNATSGSLTFSGKADTVLLETTMGTLDFSGTASSVDMDATSGNAQIEGIVTKQVQIDMVSGNLLAVELMELCSGCEIDKNSLTA